MAIVTFLQLITLSWISTSMMSTKPELATPLKENQLLAIEGKILSQLIERGYRTKSSRAKGLKKSGKYAIKVDLMKAYDTVRWDFINNILKIVGFPDTMVRWIMECVTTSRFSVNIYGELNGYFRGQVSAKRRKDEKKRALSQATYSRIVRGSSKASEALVVEGSAELKIPGSLFPSSTTGPYSSFESQNIRIEEYLYHAYPSTNDKMTFYPLLGIPSPLGEGKKGKSILHEYAFALGISHSGKAQRS
ncbi:hypothetical protein M9H77_12013 [Catharanthus roseus]|uniref:Uncharacterized protein n=1 Tax=Catharanthus roseus TaxID=4058 RepID=A0ACC0BGA7_CATRO|nr:hypothetical protein M9H77_12013 [Catharanthus roseus]